METERTIPPVASPRPETPVSTTISPAAANWWRHLTRWLPALLAFTPALVLGWLVISHASDTPVWDDWERGILIEKFETGILTFQDLYAPHIDHRILFPRLITLVFNKLSGGDLRWETYFGFFCGVMASIGVMVLGRMTLGKGRMNWGLAFLANLIILSPIAWDNWLWAAQIAFLLPMTCTVWALVIALQNWSWWVRLLLCLALAVVGTHSFGHGFAVWPAVFCLVLLRRQFHGSAKERIAFLSLWFLLGAAIIGCYALWNFTNTSVESHSYGQGAGNPPPSVVNYRSTLGNLTQATNFILVLAGNGFARLHLVDPLVLAPWIGGGIISLFCIMGLWALGRAWKKNPAWDAALPWLALGGATLAAMAAITLGRLNLAGVSRAASIRYVSISQYLAVAVVFLLVLWWQQRSPAWLQQWKDKTGLALVGCLMGFMIPAWNFGAQMMELCGQARLQAKAALVFINFWEPDVVWRLDKEADFVRDNANTLNKYGYLNPKLATHLDLAQFKPMEKDRPDSQARVLSFTNLSPEMLLMQGYARLPDRPSDGVLLTWEKPGDGKRTIFGMAEPTTEMYQHPYPNDLEHVGRLKPDKLATCRWEECIDVDSLGFQEHPELQEVIVRVWSFDVTRLRAYRIRGSWSINRQGQIKVVDDPISPELRAQMELASE